MACRLRQAAALAWLAIAARRSRSTVVSDSRVVTTWMPRAASSERSRTLRARLTFFRAAAVEMAAGIVAAVGCIEDHDKAGGGGGGRRGCLSEAGQGKSDGCEEVQPSRTSHPGLNHPASQDLSQGPGIETWGARRFAATRTPRPGLRIETWGTRFWGSGHPTAVRVTPTHRWSGR